MPHEPVFCIYIYICVYAHMHACVPVCVCSTGKGRCVVASTVVSRALELEVG